MFSISAFVAVPFALIVFGMIGGNGTSGIKFLMRHTEIYVPYLLVPAIVAYISAFLLVDRIKFKPEIKNNNRKSCWFNSILIVVLSLFLWACVMVFIFPSYERWMGFSLAFFAGTYFSWLLYPIGLVAGYVVWRLKKIA